MTQPPADSASTSAPVVAVHRPILVAGRTCQRIDRATRATVLVDGQEYYRAFAQSLVQARRQVLIGGWDIAPHTRLWHQAADEPTFAPARSPLAALPWSEKGRPLPSMLGPLLNTLASRRRRLHAYVLAWDFGTLFAIKRGFVPVYHMDWASHRRVRVRLDSAHPFGAAMHIKGTCVDDTIAFVGGLDLTDGRWDRLGHAPDDPLRVNESGQRLPPWHDQQLLVEGPAAAAVGAYLRDRWTLATGQRLPRPPRGSSVWPSGLRAEMRDVDVGLVRTAAAWDERPERREVEALYLALVERAHHQIYLENQYLSSSIIAHALARRLAEEDGPEVIIITSKRATTFIEHATMDSLRSKVVARLQGADQHGRLRILYPVAGPDQPIKVHAKSAIVDEQWLTVGSANLANRSMGLDVELNLAIEASGPGQDSVRAYLARHRAALLAEHLGCQPEDLRRAQFAHGGSLVLAIDSLVAQAGPHTLRPLEAGEVSELLPTLIGDPEQALDLAVWADKALPDGVPRSIAASTLRVMAALVLLAGLETVWHQLPSAAPRSLPHGLATFAPAFVPTFVPTLAPILATWLEPAAASPLTLAATGLALLVAGLLPLPMGALLCLVGFAFGSSAGLALGVSAAQLSALIGWMAGRLLGPNHVRAAALPRLNALTRKLSRGGILSVAELRIVPRYTWADVNLLAGASHLDLRDFLAGTLLGLLPGAALLVSAGALVGHALREPGLLSVPLAIMDVVLLAAGLSWLWHRQHLLPGR